MTENAKDEFHKIYKEKIEPFLQPYEDELIAIDKKSKELKPLIIISIILIIASFIMPQIITSALFISICLGIAALLCLIICTKTLLQRTGNMNKKVKQQITRQILHSLGDYQFSQNKNLITLKEIQNYGLFKNTNNIKYYKNDDDIITGTYGGCSIVINECQIETDSSKSGSWSNFRGIIIKAAMKKKFSGLTVFGSDIYMTQVPGTEPVELESIDFMLNRKIYTTDQVEARYILTTAFMEKLDKIAQVFNSQYLTIRNSKLDNPKAKEIYNRLNSPLNAVFYEGYAYLFISSFDNLFEITPQKTFYDEKIYYKVYEQLITIQDLICYLNIDKNTGL